MFDLEAQHAIKGSDTDIGVAIGIDHKQLSIRTNGYGLCSNFCATRGAK